jgi:hypothetical protein
MIDPKPADPYAYVPPKTPPHGVLGTLNEQPKEPR